MLCVSFFILGVEHGSFGVKQASVALLAGHLSRGGLANGGQVPSMLLADKVKRK